MRTRRLLLDCRDFPTDAKCSISIEADTETELLRLGAKHAVDVHDEKDDHALRMRLKAHVQRVLLH